jgi:choline kinase
LPLWYDVDTPEDLEKLKKELTENSAIAAETFEFLRKL